jgi:hypothetical protein
MLTSVLSKYLLISYFYIFLVSYWLINSFQVMYAFVMRYASWEVGEIISRLHQKTGPVAQPVYKAVLGTAVEVTLWMCSNSLSSRRNSNYVKLEEFSSFIPCCVIHSDTTMLRSDFNGKAEFGNSNILLSHPSSMRISVLWATFCFD